VGIAEAGRVMTQCSGEAAPEIGVDELHGDQRSASENDMVSVSDIVPQPLKAFMPLS
jgi:hypothetical protein